MERASLDERICSIFHALLELGLKQAKYMHRVFPRRDDVTRTTMSFSLPMTSRHSIIAKQRYRWHARVAISGEFEMQVFPRSLTLIYFQEKHPI